MKKFYFTIVLALIAASCTNKIEGVFSQNASERINALEQECFDLLLSSENGWLIQYYPSSSRAYGGFTFAAVFEESGDVTVTADFAADPSATITSHFSINTSNGVCLSFDTYNEYIHYLSDPDYFSSNAYGGDFEFAFVGGDTEELTFRGIKTDNIIRFIALDTDIVSAMQQVVEIKNEDKSFTMYVLSDGTELEGDADGYNLITYLEDPDDPYSTVTVPYAYSLTGITFYEPAELQGQLVQDFTWDASSLSFISNEEDTSVQIFGQRHENYISYTGYLGDYTFVYSDGSRTLTLVENVYGTSYLLENFFDYSPVVTYTPSGYLTIFAQYLGPYGENYAWLCPYDYSAGYYTWSTSVGLNLVNNGNDPDNLSFTFEDNGAWGSYTATAFLIREFSSQTASSSTSVATIMRIRPSRMTKIN